MLMKVGRVSVASVFRKSIWHDASFTVRGPICSPKCSFESQSATSSPNLVTEELNEAVYSSLLIRDVCDITVCWTLEDPSEMEGEV